MDVRMGITFNSENRIINKEHGAIVAPPSTTIADWWLYMPDYDDDEDVPGPIMLLTAIFARAQNDPDFVEDTMRWFHNLNETVH